MLITVSSTYLLSAYYNVHSVLASCLVTLILSFISFIGKNHQRLGLCFIGSFVGMSAQVLSYLDFLALSILVLITVFILNNRFVGFGGKFGTTAFISSVIYLALNRVIL